MDALMIFKAIVITGMLFLLIKFYLGDDEYEEES